MIYIYRDAGREYIFDFGYSNTRVSETCETSSAVDEKMLIISMLMQIVMEFAVIFVSLIVQVLTEMPVLSFFSLLSNPVMITSHVLGFICSITWALYSFKTLPNYLVCSSNDPCMCGFPLYNSVCSNPDDVDTHDEIATNQQSHELALVASVLALVVTLLLIGIVFWKIQANKRVTALQAAFQVQSLALSLLFSYNIPYPRVTSYTPISLTGDLPSLITRCNHSHCPFSPLITASLLV